MEKLVVASGNAGKIKEIKSILGDFYEVVSMKEMGFNEDIDETGETFFENALLKAKTVSKALNCIALADDSGLMVEALNGAPGIYSARYSGEHGNDKSNRDLLIKNLKDFDNKNAKFVSSVVLYKTDGTYVAGYGETTGKIIDEEKGNNGFGYDCIFLSDDLKVTFGEASFIDKNKVSHRYRALCDLSNKLKNV